MLAGDTVLVPHEALSDTPAWLTVPRLRRRFRCGVREAARFGELFLALDVEPDVVAWCEGEARRRGVACEGDRCAFVRRPPLPPARRFVRTPVGSHSL